MAHQRCLLLEFGLGRHDRHLIKMTDGSEGCTFGARVRRQHKAACTERLGSTGQQRPDCRQGDIAGRVAKQLVSAVDVKGDVSRLTVEPDGFG